MILYVFLSLIATYGQYDTIAYPKDPSVSQSLMQRVKRVGTAVKGFLGFGGRQTRQAEKAEEFKLPSMEEMCHVCLQCYLQDYYVMLSKSDFPPGYDVVKVVGEINRIYRSVLCPLAIYVWSWNPQEWLQQRLRQVRKYTMIVCERYITTIGTSLYMDLCVLLFKFAILIKVLITHSGFSMVTTFIGALFCCGTSVIFQDMKVWLEEVVEELVEESDDSGGRRIVSALTIAHCFLTLELSQPKHENFLFPVLEMLQLSVDLESRRCHVYDLVRTFIQRDHGLANWLL